MSVRGISTITLGAIAFGVLATACSNGTGASSDLGNVNEAVAGETTDKSGVTERIIVTVGQPANLDLVPVDSPAVLVAPWEYDPGRNCEFADISVPSVEVDRGVAQQSGVHVAYFIAEFESSEIAEGVQSSVSRCYPEYTATLAATLGRTPGTTDLQQQQELSFNGTTEFETRVSPPSFGDPGPVTFTARDDRTVAFLIDLDNTLDVHDAWNLAGELVHGS